MKQIGFKAFYRRNLPHYQPEYGYFSINFRLAFTLPEHFIKEMVNNRKEFDKQIKAQAPEHIAKLKEEYRIKSNEQYDTCLASLDNSIKWLSDDRIAKIIMGSIHYLDHKKYELIAFCIMPNHVHLIIKPLLKNQEEFYQISEIVKSIKSYTSKKCKIVLGLDGYFWHSEYYDHFIRNESDFINQLNYLVMNPVKAGLIDDWEKWTYTFVKKEYLL